MASFEGSIGTPSGAFNLKVEYSYSQSTTGNYSDVWATGYVKRNRTSVHAYNSSSSASLSINGSSAGYGGAYDLRSDGYKAIVSHSVRVYHDNNGNATIPISFSFNGLLSSYYPNGSISSNITLPKINRQANVTSATDFTDETNPTIKYSNPGGFRINARLEFAGSIIRRDNISNTGSYTFSLTEEERNLLRSKTPNSNTMTVREVIATCIGGTTETHWSWQDKKMTIVNANPVFSNFEYEDTNPVTLALTGNNQNIIQGYSFVKATIPVANIATAQKSATMSKYSFVVSDDQRDITYSSTSSTNNTIEAVKSGVFNVYAIDSRNNSTLVTKNALQTIAYNPLIKGDIAINRNNGTSEQTTLVISGKADLIDFGNTTNSIQQAKYRYKQTDSDTWSNYNNITLIIDQEGNFSFNGLIQGDTNEGFDIEHSYNIEVYIQDELSDITYTANLGSGIPGLAIHKQGIGIMGKYDTNEGGLLQISSKNILKNSTNEIDTGFKWIDGKPIYRKVIECRTGNSAGTQFTYESTPSNIDTMVRIDGMLNEQSARFPINAWYSNAYYISAYYNPDGTIRGICGSSLVNRTCFIIIEYTKTTD